MLTLVLFLLESLNYSTPATNSHHQHPLQAATTNTRYKQPPPTLATSSHHQHPLQAATTNTRYTHQWESPAGRQPGVQTAVGGTQYWADRCLLFPSQSRRQTSGSRWDRPGNAAQEGEQSGKMIMCRQTVECQVIGTDSAVLKTSRLREASNST